MGLFSALAPFAAPLVGGLLGGASAGGDQTQTQVTDLPEWLKPYYTGGSDGLTGMVPGQPPINQDFLYWNQMAGMGYPIGPPPPMYTDNPWYTGENVYQPPGTFLSPMQNIATNPPGGLLGGAPGGGQGPGPGGGGGMGGGGMFQYPSQQVPQAPPQQAMPGMSDPVMTGGGDLSPMDQMALSQYFNQMSSGYANDPQGMGGGGSLGMFSPEGREYWATLDPREKRQQARKLGWR